MNTDLPKTSFRSGIKNTIDKQLIRLLISYKYNISCSKHSDKRLFSIYIRSIKFKGNLMCKTENSNQRLKYLCVS